MKPGGKIIWGTLRVSRNPWYGWAARSQADLKLWSDQRVGWRISDFTSLRFQLGSQIFPAPLSLACPPCWIYWRDPSTDEIGCWENITSVHRNVESRFLSGVQEPWGLRIRSNCGKRASCYLRFDFSDLPYSSGICILKGRISLGWFVIQTKVFCTSSPLKMDLVYVLPMCHWLWLGSRSRSILCGRKLFTAVRMHRPIVHVIHNHLMK